MYNNNQSDLLPKISVIIPIYNVEKYLMRCLNSVLTQTFKDFEVICVNDGSPDNSDRILKDYSDKDSRVMVINQENQGLSMARNNGLKRARGEFIYFLDSDDAIQPQTLDIVYNLATEHRADLVSWNYSPSDGVEIPNKFYNVSELKFKQTVCPLFVGNKGKFCVLFNVWTKLYKRELLDNIEFIPNIHFEDFPHTYAVLAKNPKTIILSTPLHSYTKNDDSISNQKGNPKQIKDYHEGINYVYEIYKKPTLKKELNFLKRSFLPIVLKHQLGRCRRADKSIQPMMWQAFSEELIDLNSKGLLGWRGHKLSRYFAYKKLIKENQS